ncbi:acyl-CoA oxidase domain-containing protein [Ditylenchus destructor]|nr:acyl-CoA oxidase domain-containing protein [Ditylenchus destructor]
MRNMNIHIDENHHNPDLTEERKKANFSTQSLAELIWNGKERLERRRKIAEYVESHRDLHKSQPIAFMSREQRLESVAKLSVAMMEHIDNRGAIDPTNPEDAWYFNTLVMGIDGDPFHLHYIMAIPTLMNNCDGEQLSEILPKLLNREIIATYAQTELGHGTNLNKLETTAVYDPTTEEFILNSPTITATKWWPGNLGKSANFIVVVALLFTQDSGWHGAHPFWVQIRDLETHQPLPGITVGDIGPKFGISSNDNGFLRFNNVRIPRRHMLMKHAKVTPKGEYVRPVHAKVSYTSMMFVRSIMITGQALYLANACTIAIRYSCVRRQGEILPGKGEVKILDYQTQQFRLFPQLARTFAFFFAGAYIRELYASTMQGVGTGDVSLLGDLHSLSSGLKSQVSFQVALGIEQCRMACGGHGYSDASGLPHLYTVAVGGCTYEGENMVMLLQVARYLMKRAREICSGDSNEHSSSVTNYLFSKESKNQVVSFSINNCQDSALHAFEHLSRRLTLSAYDKLETLKRGGQGRAALSHQEAWNELAVDLTKAARAHTRTFIARNFVERVAKIQDAGVKNVMADLLSLYLNYELMECSSGLLEDGYINSRDMDVVRNNAYDCLRRIRPQAVSIVDSFEFCDKELNSVLGRKDGRVYENLLKWAQDSPLNKTEVLPFHEKYLGRAMKNARQKSKL